MNEILFSRTKPSAMAGRRLKNLIWNTASMFALHGLCPWSIESDWVLRTEADLPLPGLGVGFDGCRVVHLTDLHCSSLIRPAHLEELVEMANDMQPDFVVLTGDFISSSTRHFCRSVGQILGRLQPREATLACLGNHDYGLYHPTQPGVRGLSRYLTGQLETGGVRVLTSESVTFTRGEDRLAFVGMGDLWTSEYRPREAFSAVSPETPVLALCHNPDAASDLADLGADVVLAGHTHGRPVGDHFLHRVLFPTACRDLIAGFYDLGNGRRVYVNRGVGPSRRGQPETKPEIACFTLRPARRPRCVMAHWSGATVRAHVPAWRQGLRPPVDIRL